MLPPGRLLGDPPVPKLSGRPVSTEVLETLAASISEMVKLPRGIDVGTPWIRDRRSPQYLLERAFFQCSSPTK